MQYYPVFMKKFRSKLFEFRFCDISDFFGTAFADIECVYEVSA